MTFRRFRAALLAGAAALMIAAPGMPARAQWIVFDPTNYAQNVLTAARELQQVNNEIQMLENRATSLLNQARNLASLPYSSLASLQQQISQTQQLLGQAQRIAYNWRLAFFGALALSGGLAGGLVWQSALGTITPWVVQVDKLGQAQAVAPAVADYHPTDPQIAWYLAHFIKEVRSIPADPIDRPCATA